jgi:hypothetical protein
MKVDSKANYTQEVTAHRYSWLRTQDAELSPAERKRFQPVGTAHRIGRNCKSMKKYKYLVKHLSSTYKSPLVKKSKRFSISKYRRGKYYKKGYYLRKHFGVGTVISNFK